jgi:hypothetical protein
MFYSFKEYMYSPKKQPDNVIFTNSRFRNRTIYLAGYAYINKTDNCNTTFEAVDAFTFELSLEELTTTQDKVTCQNIYIKNV